MESCLMPWCSSSASKLTSNIIMTAMLVIIVMANVSRLRIARNQETTYSTTQTLQDSLSRPSHDLESKMCNAGYNQYKDKRQDNYLNRQYLSLEKGQYRIRFDRKNTNLTDDDVKNQDNQHGSCPLKIFTMKDVVKCFDYLAMRRNQRPMHITFMGDSTIRQQFLSFLNFVPDYDRNITRNSTKFAEYYFHEDRNTTSVVMNDLLISFNWRNLMRNDLISDFQRWASYDDNGLKNPAPDIVVIGVTCHHLRNNEIATSLEEYEHVLANVLLPVMKQSLNANPFQEIIWVHANPINDYVGPIYTAFSFNVAVVNNHKLIKYNKSIRRILKGSGITMWDSMNVIVEDFLQACFFNQMLRDDVMQYLNCDDYIHPGYIALSVSTQLLINHICAGAP